MNEKKLKTNLLYQKFPQKIIIPFLGFISTIVFSCYRSYDIVITSILLGISAFFVGIFLKKKGKKELILFFLPMVLIYCSTFFSRWDIYYVWLIEIYFIVSFFALGYFFRRIVIKRFIFSSIIATIIGFIIIYFFHAFMLYKRYNFSHKNTYPINTNNLYLLNYDSTKLNIDSIINLKTSLFDFSFIGCKPCKQKTQELVKLQTVLKQDTSIQVFRIIDGAINSFSEYKEYSHELENNQLNILYDASGNFSKALDIKSYPHEFIISNDFFVKYTTLGFNPEMYTFETYTKATLRKLEELKK